MCVFVERVNLNLFPEPLDRFLVLALPQVNSSQIVIGVFLLRVDLNLFLEGTDSQVILP